MKKENKESLKMVKEKNSVEGRGKRKKKWNKEWE